MTKQHSIAMADMAKYNPIMQDKTIINVLADFCQKQNPNFKRERWIEYINGKCGKNGGQIK